MSLDVELPYCFDLPIKPRPEIGKILVSGGTGYIGGRLVRELMIRGYAIRVLVRSESPDYGILWPGVEVFVGDALNYESLCNAMKGVKIAFYLIHSLHFSRKNIEAIEIELASNFRKAAEKNNVGRIIYLGGLGDIQNRKRLSNHLKSRLKVAEELSKGTIPVTTLRAAIIIGSGSASFEILKNLVKNAPVLLIPKWAWTLCQPIGIRDIIKYLIGVMELNETRGKIFDIGGATTLSYVEMLKVLSGIFNKKNIYLKSSFSNYIFYGYVASFFTPVAAPIIMALFESAENEVICLNNDIKKVLNFEPLTYQEAIINALDREEQDGIRTRWSDAYPPAHELAIKLNEIKPPKYISTFAITTEKSASSLYQSICKVGGKEGWFHNNWMWRTRGMIDRVLMGVGTSRGRKSNSSLRVNDVIGFWRIEDLKPDERMLLRAEMKIPGKAWLEFKIGYLKELTKLSVTAYFSEKGVLGKIYWYLFVPFHNIIFKNLIREIEIRS